MAVLRVQGLEFFGVLFSGIEFLHVVIRRGIIKICQRIGEGIQLDKLISKLDRFIPLFLPHGNQSHAIERIHKL